jgi:hypothetical protein
VVKTIQGTDVSRCTYWVTGSVEDDEFVATCAEFPSLSWLAQSQAAALKGLVEVVGDTVAGLASNARTSQSRCRSAATPASQPSSREGLHIRLAIRAAEDEHLSLHQHVVQRLSDAS